MCNWSYGVKLHLTFLDRGHAPKKYACTCAYACVCVCLFVVCVANLLNRPYMCMYQYSTRCQLHSSGGGRERGEKGWKERGLLHDTKRSSVQISDTTSRKRMNYGWNLLNDNFNAYKSKLVDFIWSDKIGWFYRAVLCQYWRCLEWVMGTHLVKLCMLVLPYTVNICYSM